MSRYEQDFYGWTQEQADLIRAGKVSSLDLENLLEEIESMGRSEQRALGSRLEVLLMHLLKWQYQPDRRSTSWRLTIEDQRERIALLVEKNPSFKHSVPEIYRQAYHFAIRAAMLDTGLDRAAFPAQCPWSFEQVMDENFWPQDEGKLHKRQN